MIDKKIGQKGQFNSQKGDGKSLPYYSLPKNNSANDFSLS